MIFGFMSQNGSEVFLCRMVVRLNFKRILETHNRLVQPVETYQHHSKIQMAGDMTGIDLEYGGVFADGFIRLIGGLALKEPVQRATIVA
jgi:hypothetical protein